MSHCPPTLIAFVGQPVCPGVFEFMRFLPIGLVSFSKRAFLSAKRERVPSVRLGGREGGVKPALHPATIMPEAAGQISSRSESGGASALRVAPQATVATAASFVRARVRQAGFTLLELLVVMVIIGLLAGYVGPRFFSQIGKSEVQTARAQINALEKALDQFRLDVGRYPLTEEGLAALNTAPAGERKWQGPYLRKAVPDDPWEKPYQYRSPGEHGEFDLFSFGKDGQPGGEGEAADIVNW